MYPSAPVKEGILLAVALITTGDSVIAFIKPVTGTFSLKNKKESGNNVISGIR